MDGAETTETRRTRQLWRVAVVAGITLIVLVLVAVGVYVIAFLILSPALR
jgi:hypothetical protein